MLSFVIILSVMSTVLELMIAAKIPAWRRLSHRNKIFNLLNSIFISYLVGIAFGAAGLIAMTAGIVSTILSIPGYSLLHWAYDSPQALANGGDMFKHCSLKFKIQRDKWKQVLSDFARIVYKILRIITAPIWITRAIIIKINQLKTRYARP